jgi:hypothetical protein
MKTSRDVMLPLVGLLALLIYILACTSFSPDDKKILFPTFDANGAVAMAIYDRDTRRTEPLFVPVSIEIGTNLAMPSILRGTWLPDGRNILVASASEGSKDQLDVTLVPAEGRGAVRSFRIFGVEDPGLTLMLAPCVSGNRFFFRAGPDRIERLDLRTGELKSTEVAGAGHDLNLYPSADGRGIFYVCQTNSGVVFGRVDPEQLALTPVMMITNNLPDGAFFAYNAAGTQVAFVDKAETGEYRCVLMEKGKTRFTSRPTVSASRKLDSDAQKMTFGNAILSPRGDKVWAAFTREAPGTNRIACGLMEIPLTDAPIREKVLIADTSSAGDGHQYYWQVGMSHDGKTAALSSTYLACSEEPFKPEDCALYIVDLGNPEWKVTKVPIPLPSVRRNPVGK